VTQHQPELQELQGQQGHFQGEMQGLQGALHTAMKRRMSPAWLATPSADDLGVRRDGENERLTRVQTMFGM
jgi:hypothetical protein